MALIYDTDKIRRAARQVASLSERLEAETLSGLKRAGDETEALKGEAAQALEESIEQLRREVRNIDNELEELGQRLFRFAARLEAADDRMASMMQ